MPIVLSLFSRRHHRSPATSPALLLVATSLSTSAVHQPSPFSLSSHSRCRPTATTLPPPLSLSSLHPLHIRPLSLHLGIVNFRCLLSLTSTVGFFLRCGRYRCSLLSLFFAALPSPPRHPFVGYLSIRKNLHGFKARRPRPPTFARSFPLPLLAFGLGPFLSHRCHRYGLLHRGPPPPTKTSCRHSLPYSSSTDVVAASLFLHRCPASPPATQEDPRSLAPLPLLVSTSIRCHGLEPEMGIG